MINIANTPHQRPEVRAIAGAGAESAGKAAVRR
jgi:hypothetical protein